MIWRALLLALALFILPGLATTARADEGWIIHSQDVRIAILPDSSMEVAETLRVDFGSQQKHGIFREIPVAYDYDNTQLRVYDLQVTAVTDVNGKAWKYEVSREGGNLRIKIGDPDVTVSGPQTYRITYHVAHALNAFADHDELYWNVNGTWPVRTEKVVASVTLPGGSVQKVDCFQGPAGATDPCQSSVDGRTATFATTHTLPENGQLTVVVALPKGVVTKPTPKLERKPREVAEFFDLTPGSVGGSLAMLLAVLGAMSWSWWHFGRDRRYTTMYYLTDNPAEETRPLLSRDPIVVEYKPPEGLRPAQLGLILDESADTLDVVATIIDLAVRGYLQIKEIRTGGIAGLFTSKDWEFTRLTDKDTSALLPYEQEVLDGVFRSGTTTSTLSSLRNQFYKNLERAKSKLYDDSMRRKWFARRPDNARGLWAGVAIALIVAGGGAVWGLGALFGAGLLGVPLVIGGVLMLVTARWMAKRTAPGREVLRRTLGFRQYIATAEQDRQQFNEQRNIFAAYLPYAIVFRCVDKWANAFRDIDTEPEIRSWYTGSHAFVATDMSRSLESFSSSAASSIASTPGGSGSSGFSGGSSGGGGGGGGGGSW
ncbi:MAG TPA: DUF2207 domain-containing protein [Chloroflexota bacterium]|nr:DUF2207 domain-containing protein [Chloroflexota bacterium]